MQWRAILIISGGNGSELPIFIRFSFFFFVKIKVKLIRYELMQTKTRKQTGTVAAETMPEGDADPPEQIPCASLHHGKDTSL